MYICISQWISSHCSHLFTIPLRLKCNEDYVSGQKGHFQTSIAFTIAQQKQESPIKIAESLAQQIKIEGIECYATHPGFINFELSDNLLLSLLDVKAIPEPPRKMVLDFGGPNIAKPMHIGHIRSFLLGESLRRLYIYLGHEVISDIHLGDCGTQLGMVAYGFQRDFPHSKFLQCSIEYPASLPFGMDYLSTIYPEISALSKRESKVLEHSKELTRILQKQLSPGWNAWWELVRGMSLQYIKKVASDLGCHFDLWMGEADSIQDIDALFAAADKAKCLKDDQGCKVITLAKSNLLVQKRDGAYLYATTDLATLQWRCNHYSPDAIIYVADKRQNQHFEDVFQASRLIKLGSPEMRLHHVGFGMILDKDKKPFKTRSGSTLDLQDIIQEARQHIRIRGKDEEAIALSTIKFAILSVRNHSNILYAPHVFTQYEGKTGAYIMYTQARIRTLMSKLSGLPQIPMPLDENARKLLLCLVEMTSQLHRAAEQQDPSLICDYVFRLAQTFNQLYQKTPIMTDPTNSNILKVITHLQGALVIAMQIIGLHQSSGDM